MPLADLLSRTTSAEIALWRAFESIEPIGPQRGDFQAAVVAAAVVNMLKGRKARPVVISDFLYFAGERPAPPTRKQRAAKLRGQMQELEAAMNERKRRRGNHR
jgi:hypothetical protein